jgi:hypothetical protein
MTDFLEMVDQFSVKLRAVKGKQIQSAAIREQGIILVRKFFDVHRPRLRTASTTQLEAIDSIFQGMYEVLHTRCSRAKVLAAIKSVRPLLVSAERPQAGIQEGSGHPEIKAILQTLHQLGMPEAAASITQAAKDFQSERLSWRGTVTELREALREVLDHFAPDVEVKAMVGYKQEPNTSGPTMRQKVKYIFDKRGLGKGKSDPAAAAVEGIDSIIGTWVRSVYVRASISTHTHETREEALRVYNWVRVVLSELLEVSSG